MNMLSACCIVEIDNVSILFYLIGRNKGGFQVGVADSGG